MKRITMVIMLFAFLGLFGGCGEGKEQENSPKECVTATPIPEQWTSATGQGDPEKEDRILTKRAQIIEAMESGEQMELAELSLYAGKEASLLNSNVLHNFGYLTYDEAGTIYFTDRNIGGIFVADRYGKNRWQLTSDSGKNLQIAGEWLYYLSTGDNYIKRIHLETHKAEIVWGQSCEAFLIWQEKLYINGFDGFYAAEPDGGNPILLHKQELMLYRLQVAENGLWLGNAYNEYDYAFMMEGHLLTFEETKNIPCYIEKGIREPLLAGKWICFGSGRQKIWDLETDTETELNFHDDNCVSDGIYLYACAGMDEKKIMYRFDGAEKEELFCMESELYARNKFLTPNMLYWMLDSAGGDWLYELWYYDLETGETGKIY